VDRKLNLKTFFDLLLHQWPILVGLALLGGIIGFLLSYTLPPIYESKAIMAVGLDFDRDPPVEEKEQDRAESKVSALIQSDAVLEETLELLHQDSSIEFQLPALEELSSLVQVRKYFSHWHLAISHEDPVLVTEIVNVWAVVAEDALWEAYSHAQSALRLQEQLDGLQSRLEDLIVQANSKPEITEQIVELEESILQLEQDIRNEVQLSQGVVTSLTFNLTNAAQLPDQPKTRARGDLILAGSFLGLLAGIVFFYFRVIWKVDSVQDMNR
jgi:uncharacterized protein involved in exopolysaccharide biosynthesis